MNNVIFIIFFIIEIKCLFCELIKIFFLNRVILSRFELLVSDV